MGCKIYILLDMLITAIIPYDFWVKLVSSVLPNVCLLMKLEWNALPNVLYFDIVSGDFMLLWSKY